MCLAPDLACCSTLDGGSGSAALVLGDDMARRVKNAPARTAAPNRLNIGDNLLYYGDNLHTPRRSVPAGSIPLISLDPPFKSDQDYNVLFQERDGTSSTAQVSAFEDTWRWDGWAEAEYQETVERGGQLA